MAGRACSRCREVEELIAKRQVGPLQGFRSKLGKAVRGGDEAQRRS